MTRTNTILFVDSAVEDYQTLTAGISPDTLIIILDPDQDGLLQIANTLEEVGNLQSIHIISHGSSGQLQLGNTFLNSTNLHNYTEALSRIGEALNEQGDILLYGCNVAQDEIGHSFIDQLSSLTDASIAASTTITGIDGDWRLETTVGEIQSTLIVNQTSQVAYGYSLTADQGVFRVNTYTPYDQKEPVVTGLSGGGFVVTWHGTGPEAFGVFGQRYAADGYRVGDEFKITDLPPYINHLYPHMHSVTSLSDGGFAVAWADGRSVSARSKIWVQLYGADGSAVGSEFWANTHIDNDKINPSITGLSNGGFVVTWESVQDGISSDVFGQIYEADGGRLGGEFLVNTYTDNTQVLAAVTELSGGGFIVTWSSYGQDGSRYGVYGQLYAANGSRLGGEFPVNTYTDGSQGTSSVTGLSGGDFIVTWDSTGVDGLGAGIYGQLYSANGSRLGSEFKVNTSANHSQNWPSATSLSDGGFVVTWVSPFQNINETDVYGQRYGADGSLVGSEFLISSDLDSSADRVSVTGLLEGGFVVVWDSGRFGTTDIYSRRYDAQGDAVSPGTSSTTNDDYSSNTETSGIVNLSSSIAGNIETANDSDWFRVSLTAGVDYTFSLEGESTSNGTLSNPYLRGIYNSSGSLINGTTNDDGGTGLNSQLQFTPDSSEYYYISASASGGDTGTYQLTVSQDTPTEQQPITLTQSIQAAIAAYGIEPLPGYTQIIMWEDTSTGFQARLYEADNSDGYILAFRGTDITQNDIQTDTELGWPQWANNREEILQYIKTNIIDTNGKLHVTGHSLGGALAQFFTYELVNNYELKPEEAQVSLYTWNALGGVGGLSDKLEDDYQPDLLGNTWDIRHYAASGDIVSLFGDGHVGGDTYQIDMPGIDAVDFLFAHTASWLRSIVASGSADAVSPTDFQYFSLALSYELLPEVVEGLFIRAEQVNNEENIIYQAISAVIFLGHSIQVGVLLSTSGADILLTIAKNLAQVTIVERGLQLDSLVQKVETSLFNFFTHLVTAKEFISTAIGEAVVNNIIDAIGFINSAIDEAGTLIDEAQQATAEIILWVVDKAIESVKSGIEISTAILEGVINKGIELWEDVGDAGNALFNVLEFFFDHAIEKASVLFDDYNTVIDSSSDTIFGGDAQELLIGNNFDNLIQPGLGADIIFAGEGSDIVQGSPEELNGDSILDFVNGEVVDIVNSIFGLPGIVASAGSVILDVDSDLDGVVDFTLSFEGDFSGKLVVGELDGNTSLQYVSVLVNGEMLGSEESDIITGSRVDDVIVGNNGDDQLLGREGSDQILAGVGNDILSGGAGNDTLNGGAGIDTALYAGTREDYSLLTDVGIHVTDNVGTEGTDELEGIERLEFVDQNLALDIDGNAGQAYRIYKAAFDRIPDMGGLGYWIEQIDRGMDLVEASARFIDSNEFRSLYGTSPTNEDFLTALYANVLDRAPDGEGYLWWLNELETNAEKTWEKVLADFSESPENQANVAGLISNGIEYDLWS
jgi:Ca2+-binding RTX toxin-like protein